jgi:hypothetical protein
MPINTLLIGRYIKDHDFREESNEQILKYRLNFYHFRCHLFIAFSEKGEIVVKSCKKYLVCAVDGLTIVDLQDLSVGLMCEGVLVCFEGVDCQDG